MNKVYVVVSEMEEATDFQVVDVLQGRAFKDVEKARDWADQLDKDFGGKHKVIPLTVE